MTDLSGAPFADGPPRAVLDACVLAPLLMREMLLAAAREQLFTPLWSARIEAEWRDAAGKEARDLPADLVAGDLALANAAFPRARVAGWEPIEPTVILPDVNDRHVLAAAIAGRANLIVTDNIRDFPLRRLAEHGLQRAPADLFLRALADHAPEAMRRAAARVFDAAPGGLVAAPAALKKGRLPRLAKAARAWAEPPSV